MAEQRILTGDCRDVLRLLPSGSVHCVVTSPPYLGLRDYGVGGQIGLEQTVAEHIGVLVDVFREIRRVLRDDGTVWLNYGDAYASSVNGRSAAETKAAGNDDRTFRDKPVDTVKASGLKPKDLMMLPARLALALQDDGWWIRSDIIWAKPNPMPESATDRPTSAHEHVFLLSKSERYFYDADAIRTPARYPGGPNAPDKIKSPHGQGFTRRASDKQRGHSRRHAGFNDRWDQMTVAEQRAMGANARNVWQIPTESFAGEFCCGCGSYFEGQGKRRIKVEWIKGDDGKVVETRRVCHCGRADAWLSHFATFPSELARRCIAAGAPVVCCSGCGAPFERVSDKHFDVQADCSPDAARRAASSHDAKSKHAGSVRGSVRVTTRGFTPTCGCEGVAPAPATVFDPFGGSGTVGLVAYRLGRNAIMAELNPHYAAIGRARIERERNCGVSGSLLEWADVQRVPALPPKAAPVPARGEQITLMELIDDADVKAASEMGVADVMAAVSDVPPPPKPARRSKRKATEPKPEKAKAFTPPPRRALRPAKKPTERVKAQRRKGAQGRGV